MHTAPAESCCSHTGLAPSTGVETTRMLTGAAVSLLSTLRALPGSACRAACGVRASASAARLSGPITTNRHGNSLP